MNERSQGPKNLQSLLKFCLKADDCPNLKENNISPQEAAERAEWLKQVMSENCVNIGERTRENMLILNQLVESNELLDTAINSLEELQDITEHIEFAKDFIKMGGLNLIKKLLDLSFEEIILETAQLLGNITQNEENCQLLVINDGYVELLLEKIDHCESGSIVKKLVYALSCCVRGNNSGLELFKSANGISILLNSMKKGKKEAAPKCAFLLYCLVNESNDIDVNETEFSILLKELILVSDVTDVSMEYLAGVVASTLDKKPMFLNYITVEFSSWLHNKIEEIQNQEELVEIKTHFNKISEIVMKNKH